ncbi:MAG TPA: glycoside hydrolase family 3 N-terminal domain-containing protein [Ktedonobacterales bacterium]|jgi:beta-N-acetylhexosaminidase|nr:glycoside hydrolase family 3 N-terminal domain-containing protein [Ktedonobacterales bacterium]
MRRYHRLNTRWLVLCAVILAFMAAIPAVPIQATRQTLSKAANSTLGPTAAVQSKVTLPETSIDGPALSSIYVPSGTSESVIAWTGVDALHHLNVETSADGLHFSHKLTLPETSPYRPDVQLSHSGGPVTIAWTGSDASHSLNVLYDVYGSQKKLTLTRQSSISAPALLVGPGMYLAWTGTDSNHSLNIVPLSVTATGLVAGTKTVLPQFSSNAGPHLARRGANTVVLSWTSRALQLTLATSQDAVHFSPTQGAGLPEMSAFAPQTASLEPFISTSGREWIGWTGTDALHHLNVQWTTTFPQFTNIASTKTVLNEMALGGPSLAYNGGEQIAWTGTDPAHHLNIAKYTSSTTPTVDQRIDAYIASLTTSQLIGQTLMLAVYTSSYNADLANLNQALTQWHVGSAIVFTNYNGGPLQPTTLAGLQQLTQALQSHANPGGSLLLAIDEEGGTVDRLAPYYGGTPSARQLAATGNPQTAYNQAQTDAARMKANGFNVDFAPVVDVDQGGGVGSSRTFGATASTVTTYAGAFLDGLQQHGVAGTLKHWPGLGAATGNPDITLPTINQSQAQMSAIDFAPFRALLSRQPGMIMVTTVLAPAFDAQNPAMLSPTLVTTVLRGQLGYQGVIVTDALDAQGLIAYMRQQGYANVAQGLGEASVRAFLAGNDLIEAPIEQDRLAAVVAAMTQAVASGRISQARLRASVHRIIALKVRLGLMTLP